MITWAWFESFDDARRLQGATLEAAGFGPRETPFRVVHTEPGVRVRRYEGGNLSGPLILIVPAPIKRPYIWDLDPEESAVRRCLAAGRVFLADWQPAPADFGLDDYAGRLILACLAAISHEPAILIGHSLGGLFAAAFSALHPERVRALALLATPLRFGPDAKALSRMAAGVEAGELPESLPGSLLGAASFNAAPATFGWERWTDAAASFPDPAHLRRHVRVQRWTLDEFPLPRRLVADLVALIRQDRFARGTLKIHGRTLEPSQMTSAVLAAIDPHCAVVPPETVLPFLERAGSRDKTVLHYERDIGVSLQHLAPLVGPRAHRELWPRIVGWIEQH
jgi:polyhydroxyalkanoate synthase subunit PhaC